MGLSNINFIKNQILVSQPILFNPYQKYDANVNKKNPFLFFLKYLPVVFLFLTKSLNLSMGNLKYPKGFLVGRKEH